MARRALTARPLISPSPAAQPSRRKHRGPRPRPLKRLGRCPLRSATGGVQRSPSPLLPASNLTSASRLQPTSTSIWIRIISNSCRRFQKNGSRPDANPLAMPTACTKTTASGLPGRPPAGRTPCSPMPRKSRAPGSCPAMRNGTQLAVAWRSATAINVLPAPLPRMAGSHPQRLHKQPLPRQHATEPANQSARGILQPQPEAVSQPGRHGFGMEAVDAPRQVYPELRCRLGLQPHPKAPR